MAEEQNNTPGIVEMILPENDDTKRHSTGKIGVPINRAKVVSRYLSAKTGSCHDFCKYGLMRAQETKSMTSISKKVKTQCRPRLDLEIAVTLQESEKKFVPVVCPKPPLDPKSRKPSNTIVILATKKEIVPLGRVSLPCMEYEVSSNCNNDSKVKPTKQKLSSLQSRGQTKSNEMGSTSMGSAKALSSRRKSETRISRGNGMSVIGEKNLLGPLSPTSSHKSFVNGVPSMKAKSSLSLKGISYIKNHSKVGKNKPKETGDEDVPEKTLYVIETKAEEKAVRPMKNGFHSCPLSPSSSLPCLEKSLKRTQSATCATRSPSPMEKNYFKYTQSLNCATTRLPSTLTQFPNRKGWRHTNQGLHGVRSSSTSLSSLPSSKSSCSGSSEHDETENENQIGNSKEEKRNRPKRGEINGSRNKDYPPEKLNFRRGKVVEPQTEVTAPRRLKFRRKVIVENVNGKVDSKRRSFVKKEAVGREINVGTKIESGKVVLRHQDVVGKKNGRSLLNNVIEETASKLVETRKSKVKALVGAFETVISLQDTEFSVTATAH